MPLDLVDAVIAQLESVPAVTTAFGDTWNQQAQTGVAKFFTDIVDQVALPWCRITEMGETYEYMTAAQGGAVNFTSPGQLMFSIIAADRLQARQLGFLCAKALDDYPLKWPGQSLMVFRIASSRFNPSPDVGPGVPIVFNRVFIFNYEYSGSL